MVGQDQPHDTSAAAAGDAAPSGTAPDPSDAKDNRDPKDNGGGGDASGRTPPGPAPEAADDDVRRKFRESLQKKRHQQNEQRSAEGGKRTSKVQDGFGPSRSRREFRRKSGG